LCLPETTGQTSSYGEYFWNFTRIGETPQLACNYGDDKAWRECRKNLNTGAIWREPYVKHCSHSSEISKRMNELLEVLYEK